jgi:flagellin-specific chaperone FliS
MNKKKDNSWKKQIGCGYLIAIIYVVMMLVGFCSCSPRIIENTIIQHDTTRIVKVDSIWKYEKDSVFVKEKGDTIYKYVEKIRYRDRYKVDTLVRVKVDSVTVERVKEVKVQQPLSWWQKFRLVAFWWLVGAVLALLLWTTRKLWLKLFML